MQAKSKSKKKQKQELKASKDYSQEGFSSNEGLNACRHIVIEAKSKFQFLYSYLKRLISKRVKVLVSTSQSVEFFKVLLKEVGIKVSTIDELSEKGFLLIDYQAENLSKVKSDYCILYDPPRSTKDYDLVARSSNEVLLCVMPNEEALIGFFNSKSKAVTCTNSQISSEVTKRLERLSNTNYDVYSLGRAAYKSYLEEYLKAVDLNKHRDIEKLSYDKIGIQFGSFNPIAFNLDKLNS